MNVVRPGHGDVISEEDGLERRDLEWSAGLDAVIINKGAIARAKVFDEEAAIGFGKAAVLAGDGGFGEADVAGGRGPDEPGSSRLCGLTGHAGPPRGSGV